MATPQVLLGREALPCLLSPDKGEGRTFSLSLPLSGRVKGNRLPESSASRPFSVVAPFEMTAWIFLFALTVLVWYDAGMLKGPTGQNGLGT